MSQPRTLSRRLFAAFGAAAACASPMARISGTR